jgi:hypothetical protein
MDCQNCGREDDSEGGELVCLPCSVGGFPAAPPKPTNVRPFGLGDFEIPSAAVTRVMARSMEDESRGEWLGGLVAFSLVVFVGLVAFAVFR